MSCVGSVETVTQNVAEAVAQNNAVDTTSDLPPLEDISTDGQFDFLYCTFNVPCRHMSELLLQPCYDPLSGTTRVSQYQKDELF